MLLLAVAILYPVWSISYPPLLDYPNHLARVFVLAHLKDPAYHFTDWYRADWGPFPYLGMDLILVSLQRVLPVAIAGKVFLSLCLLAVPLSIWWLVRTANPGHDWLALWGLLLSYNLFFLEGFVNYAFGMAACFVTITLWLRYLDQPTLRRWLLVLLAATATYFAHLIAFVFAGFVVFVYTLAEKRRLPHQVLAGMPFLPGVLIYIASGIGRQTAFSGELYFRDFQWEKVFDGLAAYRHGYAPALESVLLWVAVAAILLGFARNPEFGLRRSWAIVFLACIALYCVLPDEVGETWDIDVRIIPVAFTMLLLLATLGRRQRLLGVIALLLFALRLGDVARDFQAKQPELARLDTAVRSIPRGSTVLPLVDEHNDDDPLQRPWVHFWAYNIVECGAREPYLFDQPGQTTLRIITRSYIPKRPLTTYPPDFDRIRRDYDFVWLYGFPQFKPDLDARGQALHTTGDLTLYRMTKGDSGGKPETRN